MTAIPPSEDAPQPVAARPGWVWWRGADGLLHARRAGLPDVAAHNFTTLLARIRRAEGDEDG